MHRKKSAIVIDDEALARDIIKKYSLLIPDLEIIAECSNGLEGIKKINEFHPDIIFLDIQMPKLTGFEMLDILEDIPQVIFSTAYDQYALKAFEVNAVDYLLKPYSESRFREAVSKAILHLDDRDKRLETIGKIRDHIDSHLELIERIVVKSGTKIFFIPVEKVVYLEAQDDYVMIYTAEGKYLKQKTMKYFEEHLDPKEFIRVHRSYIVSIKHISQIELMEKETFQLTLDRGKSLPVSKTGYTRLKEIFN